MKFSFSGEFDTLQDIKEKHGYVALDFDREVKGKLGFIQITRRQIATTALTSCLTVRRSRWEVNASAVLSRFLTLKSTDSKCLPSMR